MPVLLDILYSLGYVLASPWLAWRYLRRRGGSGAPAPDADPPTGGIWLHGSSVGEVSLLKPMIERIERERPDLPLVVSSHTATGVEAARRAYARHRVFRFPRDFSFVQRRWLARLAPCLIVVAESDLWPNHLLAARRAGVPVAVVNGKLSERSYRLHRLSRLVPRAMRDVAVVAAQTEAHAARFAGLGIARERIAVTGNMKYDLTSDTTDAKERRRLRAELSFDAADLVVIGGSLHPGEDRDLLAACATARGGAEPTRLVIVPRYPDQAAAVIANAEQAGFRAVARSTLGAGAAAADDAVIVVDTLGELRGLYGAADIAFVGGSLYYRGANKGGHNLMEPAILGLPVLFGPHNFSFRETVADLKAADAGIEVADRAELTAALAALLQSPSRRAELGRRARQVVIEGQGASARNVELLLTLIDSAPGCSAHAQAAQFRHQTLESTVE